MEFYLSVIVPVYGVEKYIKRCLDTLFRQTIASKIEYIFIDDNSPDSSVEIIEKTREDYGVSKDNVTIIRHQKNMGVSRSRQDGLERAHGKYVIHCDPDDWIEPDAYELLYDEAEKGGYDLVSCDYNEVDEANNVTRFFQRPSELNSEYIVSQFAKGKLIGSTCNKLLRREVAQSVDFKPGISYCEDLLYFCKILSSPLKISHIDRALYNYRQHTCSLIHTIRPESVESDIHLFSALEKVGKENPRLLPFIEEFGGRTLYARLLKYETTPWQIKQITPYRKWIGKYKSDTYFTPAMVRLALWGSYPLARRIYKIINHLRQK